MTTAALKDYEVTITPKFPTYGNRESVETITAKTAADAIKQAREMVRRSGYTRQDGSLTYSAKRKTA